MRGATQVRVIRRAPTSLVDCLFSYPWLVSGSGSNGTTRSRRPSPYFAPARPRVPGPAPASRQRECLFHAREPPSGHRSQPPRDLEPWACASYCIAFQGSYKTTKSKVFRRTIRGGEIDPSNGPRQPQALLSIAPPEMGSGGNTLAMIPGQGQPPRQLELANDRASSYQAAEKYVRLTD